ncbi:YbaK / prolyl-tRNA synthetases associated domain containing protein [Histomonas meleagridis]|nr:YbaK / prolyl-tRNA synthetases associated domain containing protein [Histomonas meleagridis]
MLGLDSKRTRTPLYKITVMLVDLSASLLGTRRKINGFYVVFVQKEEEKLERTIEELKKYVNPICIIVDNRAKSNFGQKMQTAEISMLKHTIVISSKLDKDTVSVDNQPVAISELKTLTEY